MQKSQLQAVILAAGRSSRLNSGTSKLLEKICGQEMILYPIELCKKLSLSTTLVLGYEREKIQDLVEKKNIRMYNMRIKKNS